MAQPTFIAPTVECSVCFAELRSAPPVAVLACGHVFHGRCVARWRQQRDTCPLCREPIAFLTPEPVVAPAPPPRHADSPIDAPRAAVPGGPPVPVFLRAVRTGSAHTPMTQPSLAERYFVSHMTRDFSPGDPGAPAPAVRRVAFTTVARRRNVLPPSEAPTVDAPLLSAREMMTERELVRVGVLASVRSALSPGPHCRVPLGVTVANENAERERAARAMLAALQDLANGGDGRLDERHFQHGC